MIAACARMGLTLFEVTIAMLILASAVTVAFVAVGSGLKAQQLNRLQAAAAIRAMQLSEAFANMPNAEPAVETETAEMAESGVEIENDLERRVLLGWQSAEGNGFSQRWTLGRGNVGVVPPEIAARLDDDDRTIAGILAQGGQLFYFRRAMAGRSTSDYNRTEIQAPSDLNLSSDDRQLIFAVRGLPQQNSLRGHPLLGWPYHEHYPFPLQPWHLRLWAWNLDLRLPAPVRSDCPVQGVSAIAITANGTGYAEPPDIDISPPITGRQARGRAIVNCGVLLGIHILDPGFGYTAAPVVTITPRNGGGGATATASIAPVKMVMVDYARAEDPARSERPARWRTVHPQVDWTAADEAMGSLYDYCYHFLRPDGNHSTWLVPPGRKRIQDITTTNPAFNTSDYDRMGEIFQNISGITQNTLSTWDYWRDPLNRFSAGGIWRTQVGSAVLRSDPAFYDTISYVSSNYDNASSESLTDGSASRARELLVRAQRLVRTVMQESLTGPVAGTTRATYVERDLGFNAPETWPIPYPPKALPPPGPGGWNRSDEQIYPPPYVILALSYLAHAAQHAATRISAPANAGELAAHWSAESDGLGSVTVLTGGAGYSSTPRVTIVGGGGSGCVAQAVLVGGTVARVIVLEPGSGYTGTPTINFTGGGGAGATATANLAPGLRWNLGRAADEAMKLRAYAKAVYDGAQPWFARYASADPYDWGAPRPANRTLAWDYPLLQWDLFPPGAMRPTPAQVGVLPSYRVTPASPYSKPNSADLDLASDLPGGGSPSSLFAGWAGRSLFDRSMVGTGVGASLLARWRAGRDRPAWRFGGTESQDPSIDDIDRSWKVIAGRQPINWGGSNALRHYQSGGRIMQQNLPPGSPGQAGIRPGSPRGSPPDKDNCADLWYSWGDHSRFNLCASFDGAERCREILFWAVDWMSYEDFEAAPELAPGARDADKTSTYSDNYVSEQPRGEWRTRGARADNALGVQHALTTVTPIDRDGNGNPATRFNTTDVVTPDRGTVPAVNRMRAVPVGRFVFYDSRLIGGMRQ